MIPENRPAQTDQDVDRLVRAEQVEVIYRQAIPAMLISIAVASLLSAILWDVTPRTKLIAWLAAIIVVALVRAGIVFFYWRTSPRGLGVLAWERPFILSLMVSAAVWGIGGWLLLPADSTLHQAVVYFFLMGMTGGSAALYSAHFFGVAFTILIILVPATVALFAERALIPVGLAAGGCIYVLSTLRSAKLFAFFRRRSAQLAHELSHAHAKAEELARTDELTGLHNRRSFLELGRLVLDQAGRFEHSVSLVMLDVDYFKRINDTHGHAAGDAALQHVARFLQENLRSADICGRLGGEEFAVLLPATSADDALAVAEKLRELLAASPVAFQGMEFQVTASFGVAATPGQVEELLQRADAALYRAKHEGRNRVMLDGGVVRA